MHALRVSPIALSVAGLAHLMAACAPDLGECDEAMARSIVYTDDARGLPAYAGQALVQRSCGGGSFCHAEGATPADRHGAPHGLDFDLGLATDAPSTERLRRAQRDVYESRGSVMGSVEGETMPPGEVGESIRDSGPRYRDLPEIDTPEGQAILRSWLACRAPVVERTSEDRPTGVEPVGAVVAAMPACADTICGDACVDTTADSRHCGGCDVPCGSDQYCDGGTCAACAGAVSFSADVAPLFESKGCTATLCHGGPAPASMLDLTMGTAHGELVGAASLCPDMRPLATAGDVSASYLLNKLRGEGMCGGVRMPLGRTFLTPRELATVEAWICGGAMND